jgi:RimJ/RimL family protein N-acetyltransferase
MQIPVLETERLWIRPFARDDLEACHQLFDIEARTEVQSLDERRQWLTWAVMNYVELDKLRQPPYGDRAVVLKSNGGLVGSVGLVPCLGPFGVLPSFGSAADPQAARRHVPEVGLFWALSTAHRRQGYATEAARALIDFAFERLHLRRIVAETDYANERSMAVMRRLGMRLEKNPYLEPKWFQVVGVLESHT